MTCRRHGLSLIDITGERLDDELSMKNFTTPSPLPIERLRAQFEVMRRREVRRAREFMSDLPEETLFELDNFSP